MDFTADSFSWKRQTKASSCLCSRSVVCIRCLRSSFRIVVSLVLCMRCIWYGIRLKEIMKCCLFRMSLSTCSAMSSVRLREMLFLLLVRCVFSSQFCVCVVYAQSFAGMFSV